MKAMIFAAGLGTRLRPLTLSRPKALVEVGGEPLLGHVIRKLLASGFDDLVVNVHHFPDQIISWLRANYGDSVKVSDERDLLRDTGGGIKFARELLGGGDFLVHNVDILSNLDLRSIPAVDGSVATLVVSERKTSRYLLFDDSMRLVGWTNVSTGEVRSPWPGLRPEDFHMLAFSGIHLLREGIFDAFDALGFGDVFPIMDFYVQA
ncbi:MAG: NTP transferase domain-containing protein, partial [Bacteroidales bacterium]|nr:NTP transferase domain-containing protein [Bacteroidales bacterium]